MKQIYIIWILGLCLLCNSCNKPPKSYSHDPEVCTLPPSGESLGNYYASKITAPITVDGIGNEASWETATWKDIRYKWIGEDYSMQDFQGRYKMVWDENQLYFLVEIVDNKLLDQRKDPYDGWWEDDCLEIFIDEDRSGGDHQYNYNAFAYHITLDYDVVDLGPDKKPRLFNDHVKVKRTAKESLYTWEVAMKVYPSSFAEGKQNVPVNLQEGKKMGFAIAYNDNDGSPSRENMIGSIDINGQDKNRGWIDAGVFGELELIP